MKAFRSRSVRALTLAVTMFIAVMVAQPVAWAASKPGAPNVTSAVPHNASATVTFTAPSSNGGATITLYRVTAYDGSTAVSYTETSTITPVTVTGLTNGVAYQLKVKAQNSAGWGDSSVPLATPVTPGPEAPSAPTAVSGTVLDSSSAVSFSPGAANGSAVTGYTVTASPGGASATGTASPITVSGLTNGTAYTFTVKATNAIGTSVASTPSASVTPATTPSAPTNVVATPGDSSVSVAFTPGFNGGSPVTSYVATAYVNGVSSATKSGTGSPIVVTGLTNGTAYTFKVKAINAVGVGPSSAPMAGTVTPVGVPAAPTGASAVAGNASATVSFTGSAGPVSGYVVTSSPGGLTSSGTASPIVVGGLTNGTSYTFTVKATNSSGSSVASTATNPVTPTGPTPSSFLGLQNWKITLPTGTNGTEIKQPVLATYSDANFFLNSAGNGVVFKASVEGTHTTGSRYPRSELREMDPATGKEIGWSTKIPGTHVMTMNESIDVLPPKKPWVVGAQIHDADDDVIEVMAYGPNYDLNTSNKTYLGVRLGDTDSLSYMLDTNYVLGTPYDLTINATQAGIKVFYNGVLKTTFPTTGENWFFKAGSYVQSTPQYGGDTAPSYGQTTIHSLSVSHTS